MLKNLVRKMAVSVGVKLALDTIRDAAEGRLGPEWRARYWKAAGVKTWSGLAVAIAAAVLAAVGYQDLGIYLGIGGGFLVQAGLLDKAWRGTIPEPLQASPIYRFLAAQPELVALLFGSAAAALTQCAGSDCETYALVLAGVAAVFVQLGLLDAAWKAKPPVPGVAPGRYSADELATEIDRLAALGKLRGGQRG